MLVKKLQLKKIKDREEQKRKKQDFINEFNQFMDSYFEEVNNE